MPKNPKDENFGPVTSRLYSLFSRTFPSMKQFYSFISNDVSKRDFKAMLDIGCGPGILDIEIAKSFPEREIFGIDPSATMVKIASSKAQKNGLKNIHFEIGMNTNIPFDTKFDLIISTLSFHHWAVKRQALEYISKYLSDKGSLVIYEFLKPEKGMAISGNHSLSVAEANSYSDIKGLKLNGVHTEKGFIKAVFSKA
ncbi:MAG: class I SAM-dependent methyltransferase [Candidatus Marsarchaeota archaeon]|nr:class I SAM-dependent methyltransferase [Candidatus Marsarchaeota archaeon]